MTLRNTILGFVLWLVVMSALIMWMGALIVGPAHAKGFYTSVYGGPNFTNGISGTGSDGGILSYSYEGDWSSTTTLHGDEDTGYVIGAVLGTDIDALKGLRVELDLSYRRNNVHGTTDTVFDEEPPPEPLPELKADIVFPDFNTFQGHDTTWALMANAVYGFDLNEYIKPYVLAGVGVGERHLVFDADFKGGPSLDATESGFVYQLGAGVDVQVAKGVKLGLGYRFFQAPVIQRTVSLFPNDVVVDGDGQNQSIMASATFSFD